MSARSSLFASVRDAAFVRSHHLRVLERPAGLEI